MSSSVQTEMPIAAREPSQANDSGRASASSPAGRWSGGGEAMRYGPLFYLTALLSFTCICLVAPAGIDGANGVPMAFVLSAVLAHASALVLFAGFKKARYGAMLSTASAIAVVSWASVQTGGLLSPLLVLFILPIIEALLTRRPRCTQMVFAMTFAGVVTTLLLGGGSTSAFALPQAQITLITMLGILYALSLVARILRVITMRDVRAQAARRAMNQFHAVTHDMFLSLKRDGSVAQASGAVKTIVQCQSASLVGDGFLQRVHIADRPNLLATLDGVSVHGGRASAEVRLRTGKSDGPQAFIWVEVDISVLKGVGGENEICALVRDITAVKEHAAQLMLEREKAEASDAAKGRFLATMSHELRTPLNAIIGFADILDEEVFGQLANDQQREYVGLIRDSGGHLLQLVNDLLDMSKLDAGHFQIVAEPFAFGVVANRCTRLVGQQIEKAGLTLHVDVPDTLPEIVADQRAIRQVLINLLSNACKFTPQGGSITLRARNDNGTLLLSIIDTGIGIATHELARLGEPFFQANNAYDRNHQGTGLGLSVVKGLCELHEGSLGFSSVEGEGTTVTVRLPLKGPSLTTENDETAQKHAQANTVVLSKLQKDRAQQRALPATASGQPADKQYDENEGRRAHG